MSITISPMTEEEGKLFGLLKTETSSLFRLVSAKANHVPKGTDESAWYKLTSENLNNGDSQYYPNGDNVQVVERWVPPQISGQPTPQQLSAFKFVLEFVDSTMNRARTGDPFSLHTKGGPNSRSLLKHLIQPLAHHANLTNVEMDGKGFAKQCIDALVDRGWLVTLPPKKNGPQKGWSRAATVWDKTPWAAEVEAARKIADSTETKLDHLPAAPDEVGGKAVRQVGTADRKAEMAVYAKRIERGEV